MSDHEKERESVKAMPGLSSLGARQGPGKTQVRPFDKKAVDGDLSERLVLLFSQLPTFPFTMSIEIKIRKNEPVDRALRRLKKKLERENIIKDVRAKRYFEKPCERRRRKEKVQAFTQMLRRRYAE
jgi:small subunit ribosomal protein S21